MEKATFIKSLDWVGDARLYKLSKPAYHESFDKGDHYTEYVVVSAINTEFACETYIFPATATGEAINMLEMEGSFQGGQDHAKALAGAGYTIDGEE